jgi:protein-tyrosine phosphatase
VFDIHSHILPGIDDGATDISVSLEMARMAVANGVTVQACTPHIMPGVYNNAGPDIRGRIDTLQAILDGEGIALRLVPGSEVHLVPNMTEGFRSGHLLTLANSRYVLIEPPYHAPPLRLVEQFFNIMVAGYYPILAHPERLGWINLHYALIQQLVHGGVWMQITAGSITGAFGPKSQYWAERMLDEGKVHVIASDAHDDRRRPPNLAEGREAAAKWVGDTDATHMVETRTRCILANHPPSSVPSPAAVAENKKVPNERLANRTSHENRLHSGSWTKPDGRGGFGAGLGNFLGRMRRYFRQQTG